MDSVWVDHTITKRKHSRNTEELTLPLMSYPFCPTAWSLLFPEGATYRLTGVSMLRMNPYKVLTHQDNGLHKKPSGVTASLSRPVTDSLSLSHQGQFWG